MPEAPCPLSLASLARLDGLAPRGMRLGLDLIRRLLARLGDPQRRVPRVLIAGTNGKGSAAATLSSIFAAAGIPCGLHTSPHLEDVCERVRVAERTVLPEVLDGALARVFAAADREPGLPLTYFEAVTGAAEVLFADARCVFAVVEVGLGGRLDATNATDPVLSLVTSIALDHQADLGDTVEAIAREKAGIFRRDGIALCGTDDEAVRRTLREEARRAGARFVEARDAGRILSAQGGAFSESFTFETPRERYRLTTPLCGAHQRRNAVLAVLAAEFLSERFPALTREAIERGVAQTSWPGRLEAFPVGAATVWLDGCHNPEGAKALSGFLASRAPGYDLLFGAMADKDIEGIAREILPAARRVVLVAPAVERAALPAELKGRLAGFRGELETACSTAEGLERLLAGSSGTIVVAGSLYLVGEARRVLRTMKSPRAAIA